MAVKRGIFQGSFPASMSMRHCIEIAAELGFTGLEISTEDTEPLLPEAMNEATAEIIQIGQSVGMTAERPGAITLQSEEEHVATAAAIAHQSGIRVHSLATMMLFFYPLSSSVKKLRERGIDIVIKMLDIAGRVGADTILIVPGMVTATEGYRGVYRRSQAVIRDLASEASHRGVSLALENVWNYFLLSPLEMTRYLDEIGSDHVGAYVDVANVLPYGYPQDWLRILDSRVYAVHFKDFRKDIRNLQAFVHLLHGDVGWPSVAEALRDIGYDGYVTVEVPPAPNYALKILRDARTSLDVILDGSRKG